ncbi:MAG: hypothetical protein CFH22_01539 [Alphaproteobacteria bacterium MarineAlpha5_Bin12]|nr:MAG: hypothetical protein CFH22_01539 [Alphaproteobacteria bacterium MarineAlpha5_Bin12]|tara:strand:- start:577 stop:1140 length:564 start_codon:yes stop_codon:yes gene_type:complete
MKLFLVVIFFTQLICNSLFANTESIDLSFTQDNAKYWQYISDRTMGGISDGGASLEQDGDMFFARLTGNVSTENNGGFIQIRTNLSFTDFEQKSKKLKGIRLNVRGNEEIYHIFIRTTETRSYRDYYSTTFKATSKWTMIELPFSEFTHRVSNNSDLEGKNIISLGIVAYGRDFVSDVSVSNIIFYY